MNLSGKTATSSPSSLPKTSEELGLWEPRRAVTLETAQRHIRYVRRLRMGFLMLAGMFALILTWQFFARKNTFIIEDHPSESVKMIEPRYVGRTSDNLPYTLTAAVAVRKTQNQNMVDLTAPVLEFYRTSNVVASIVQAEFGGYDNLKQELELIDAVDLQTDDGYHCVTDQVRVFIDEQRILGPEPVICDGAFGHIGGQAFDILDNYNYFIFKNGAQGRFVSQSETEENGSIADEAPLANGFGSANVIDVRSDIGRYKRARTHLLGNVILQQGTDFIYCDDMIIYRDPQVSGGQGSAEFGKITKIDAKGHFRYRTTDNEIIGQRGVYFADQNEIIVTGGVQLIRPSGDMVEAERLVYNIKTKVVRFDDGCQGEACTYRRSSVLLSPKN